MGLALVHGIGRGLPSRCSPDRGSHHQLLPPSIAGDEGQGCAGSNHRESNRRAGRYPFGRDWSLQTDLHEIETRRRVG